MYVGLCAMLNTTSISVSATIQNYILSCNTISWLMLKLTSLNLEEKNSNFQFQIFLIANFFIKLSRALY